MKKIVCSMILFIIGILAYGQVFVVYQTKVYPASYLGGKDDFVIFTDINQSQFGIVISDTFNRAFIAMTPQSIDELRNALNKFLEWEKQAQESKVTLNKEISRITSSEMEWKIQGSDNIYRAVNLQFSLSFSSQSILAHNLVIQSNTVSAGNNQFATYKMDPIRLNKQQVEGLLSALSPAGIADAKKKWDEREQIRNQFN